MISKSKLYKRGHDIFHEFGDYVMMLFKLLRRPDNLKMTWKEFMKQCRIIGVDSVPIVFLISFFLGMVMTMQAAYMLDTPIVPRSIIATIVRDTVMLELAPAGVGAIIACVVGFKITSDLGYMNIYEQTDALKIMGVDTYAYLLAPKVMATLITVPALIIYSISLSLVGGYVIALFTDALSVTDYVNGLTVGFQPYSLWVAIIKIMVFSFVISTISCFLGYNFYGSTVELAKRCTFTVSLNCIALLICDYLITASLL